ncbi:uncharacterized protein LOC109703878 isoform X2 [Ananas comosus]|uniref:Uncharacterized protein LOC109703878 isoform X2 n=1 Tax=Ananas comosus TaxID=4615 RepID=A0A6P5EAC0_ANACO|nr:uncharacterized protein LOC109703878 isoform X2 [Ananas comosus]
MVGFFPSRPLPLATLHFVRPLDAAPTPIPSLDGMLGRVHGRPFFRSRHSRYRRFVSAYSFPPVTQMVRIHSPSEPSAGFDFTPAGFNFTSGKQIEQKLLDYNQEAERFRDQYIFAAENLPTPEDHLPANGSHAAESATGTEEDPEPPSDYYRNYA